MIDGNLADWGSITPLGKDLDDVRDNLPQIDWKSVWVAHDASNFYLAHRNDKNLTLNSGYLVFIDTDKTLSTGYRSTAPQFSIGAEFLIQNNNVFQYTGTGTDWSWNFVGSGTAATAGTDAELSFPRTTIGNPNEIRVIFYGDNPATYSRPEIDLLPDDARTGLYGYFRYGLN